MSQVVTVILAAGAGKRVGGPKALLAWPTVLPDDLGGPPSHPNAREKPKGKDRPLAIAHAEQRIGAESKQALIVTRGAYIPALLAYVRPGIDLIASDAADELGPAGSLACALPRLPRGADRIIVTPVDAIPARTATVARLLLRLATDPKLLAVRPVYKGRGGHPVVLRPEALAPYKNPKPPPLRDHLRALGDRCADQDVNDPTVLLDLDTPADVMGVLHELPRFLTS
ncbi:MAG: NTP transferase domain-containing protein [Byssovorax sp.]